ncbi:Aminodeoxychorismate lyase [hydrothermal vent metagenome]|uniref:Aminodeoxychorismate lyase n=1 Tax=hydrothermal vent metagenome TaxID=652676 RepID=A0A1W1B9B5_9ZZZZ
MLETISIVAGRAKNILYHNQRLNRSRRELYGIDEQIDLENFISPPDEGSYRCRVVYGGDIDTIEYIPYTPRDIQKIAIVDSDIEYRYKYADRSGLNRLIATYKNYDDILIVKDGFVTDTTIANVAFLKDGRWYTPKTPLLDGTTRQRLIDNGFLSTQDINRSDISDYDGFAIMNAMIDFKIININCLEVASLNR